MHPAIRVDNLSKHYRLGERQAGYKTLRESIAEAVKAPFRRFTTHYSPLTTHPSTDFWALKDVSFEVQPGEVVGIIGRNGAGKSTLLKILSRITEPTSGRIELRGRVGSLLEVGTGFHPELTGRENIYMNGSILGMRRREIARKFDEIVDFAGIEEFLDTPVKRYSSGMYVRLAFSVAAHLEPEILIVDEVLAVGDAAFQRKCVSKMGEVAQHGRTVLFVSHNLATVRTFCQTACWLENGRLAFHGDVSEAVDRYFQKTSPFDAVCSVTFERPRSSHLWMKSARLICGDDDRAVIETGDDLTIEVVFESDQAITSPKVGFAICSHEGTAIFSANNRYQAGNDLQLPSRTGQTRCRLGAVPLLAGRYTLSLWLGDERGDTDHRPAALSFDVSDRDIWGTGKTPTRYGLCWWPTAFETLSYETSDSSNVYG
jgi:lipopolysaccharide transport system ATP-binding protein